MAMALAAAELFSCSAAAPAALICCLGPSFFFLGLGLLNGSASGPAVWPASYAAGCSAVLLCFDFGKPASSPMTFFLAKELPQVSCTLLSLAIGCADPF